MFRAEYWSRGNSSWYPRDVLEPFSHGEPRSNLQQTKAQVSTRATSAHRSLISINGRSEAQGLECSHGSLESQQSLGQLQVVKHCAKAYSSSREERGVPMMKLFYLPVVWHLHNMPLLKKTSHDQ